MKDFLPLHPHDFRVLIALLDGPSYGTKIVEEIEAREGTGARLYPANLYRRIRDLTARGLLSQAPPPPGADTRRSYVRLTPLGHDVARAEAMRLRALVQDAAAADLLPGG